MIWLAILGMTAVTYLPRALPFLAGDGLKLPAWLRRWFRYFPYAALGALIFPGILSADPHKPWIGAGAGLFAALLSLATGNLTVIVAATIGFTLLLQRML